MEVSDVQDISKILDACLTPASGPPSDSRTASCARQRQPSGQNSAPAAGLPLVAGRRRDAPRLPLGSRSRCAGAEAGTSASASFAPARHRTVIYGGPRAASPKPADRKVTRSNNGNKNLSDSIVLRARHGVMRSRGLPRAPPSNYGGLSITLTERLDRRGTPRTDVTGWHRAVRPGL
jgi:hypothetical protein